MKRINLIASIGAALFAASSAMAQVNPPSWFNMQGPDDTALCLEFNSSTSINVASILWNPFGTPNMSGSIFWADQVTNHQGVIGAPPGETANLDLFIPNSRDSHRKKLFWVQVDWYVDGNSGFGGNLTTPGGEQIVFTDDSQVDIGGGWIRQTRNGYIIPQPESETWHFEWNGGSNSQNGAWMDNFCFGTICVPVPEPGSLAVLGIGVLAFARKRRK